MKIIKGATPPARKKVYDFDVLEPGDAIDVASEGGCREMFRRWRDATGSHHLRLRFVGKSPDDKKLVRFFLEEIEE